MAKFNIYRDGKVHVLGRQCSTCIFRPGNLMKLTPGRRNAMVQVALKAETGIVCHDTLPREYQAICRGFWGRHRKDVAALRLAQALDCVEFQDPPEGKN